MKRANKSGTKVIMLENSDPISAETEAIQRRVRQRAFEISQERPQDAHKIYDWIVAESEILSVPPAELIEKDDAFELKFAVAGVNPDDVNLMVTSDTILIKSEFNHSHDTDLGTVHLCDFRSATVFRSVKLPQAIDVRTATAEFADGMIRVTAFKEGSERSRNKPAASPRRAPAKKSKTKTT